MDPASVLMISEDLRLPEYGGEKAAETIVASEEPAANLIFQIPKTEMSS